MHVRRFVLFLLTLAALSCKATPVNAPGTAPSAAHGPIYGLVVPPLTQPTATSDTPTTSITLTPQAPFASATGSNRVPGSAIVNVAAPTNGGTTEAGFVLQRAGTAWAWLGAPTALGGSAVQLSLGSGASGGNGTAFLEAVSGGTILNAPTGGFVNLAIAANAVFQATSSAISFGAPVQSLTSGVPYKLGSSAVTFGASGTTTLTGAQQQTPLLVLSTVTLSGAATLAIGNVSAGWYAVDVSGVTLAGQTLTFSNGTGTIVVSPIISANKNLIHVSCTTNHIAGG